MSHPAFVNIISYFYPLGNTPAVCLTQDLPREEHANLLLLGCGDVRNILFTAYSDAKSSTCAFPKAEASYLSSKAPRQLDITCCDLETAIIARNILLLTLILEDSSGSNATLIWNIGYHLYLDDESSTLLAHQLQALQAASDSLESWHSSRYGKSLRICDRLTLLRIQKIWESYAIPQSGTAARLNYDKHFASWIAKARTNQTYHLGQGFNVTGFRSAGPISVPALNDLPGLFRHYWEHGITDVASSRSKVGNPTFFDPSEDAATLHYGTDPLLGYHLAIAYAPLALKSVFKISESSNLPRLVSAARSEFRQWSASFAALVNGKRLMVRFFNGDALAFCHSLQHRHTTGDWSPSNWYRSQYRAQPLVLDSADYALDGGAPTLFNVVDTSNLADHLGGINILTAASPLLDDSGTATLYIETLLQRENDLESLVDRLVGGHFPTLCLLLGLTPAEYWTNSTMTSSVEEHLRATLPHMSGDSDPGERQVLNRLVLRRLITQDSPRSALTFDADQLARLFYRIYLSMFQNEDVSLLMSQLDKQTFQNDSILHYHRGSLAAFFLCVRKNVRVDWNRTMEIFLLRIENDSILSMERYYIQELYVQLHLLNLYTARTLRETPPIDRSRKPTGLAAWKEIPPAVCVTLEIPRAHLKAFVEIPRERLGTPILHCRLAASAEYSGGTWQSRFLAVQLVFGEIKTVGSISDNDFKINLTEDQRGWHGTSPLVASFLAPSWVLLLEPVTATIALGIHGTVQSVGAFAPYFGIELCAYRTTLGNRRNVFVTKHGPNLSGYPSVCNFGASTPKAPRPGQGDVVTTIKADVNVGSGQIVSLTGRLDVDSDPAKSSLRNGAQVKTMQVASCAIGVTIGEDASLQIDFPVPILWSKSKTRIARSSSYVEVVVPLADTRSGDGFTHFMHPLSSGSRGPVPWNVPRLDLDRLPILDVSQTKDMEWLNPHTSLMLSARERHYIEASRKGRITPGTDARADLKDSLFSLFMHFSGLQGQKSQIFGLNDPDGGGVHILIFVSCLRLDLSSRTAVLDAAVLPLYNSLMPEIRPVLEKLAQKGICRVKVEADEMKLWKRLLPAWIERCRTWEHQPSCAYRRHSQVPLSVENGEEAICRCGAGSLPRSMAFDLARWDLIAKYAVRAAIGPSFSVPYVERAFEGKTSSSEPSKDKGDATPSGEPSHDDGCRTCGNAQAKEADKPLMKCARCHVARYCSTECQRRDWQEHKKGCTKPS